MKRWKSSSPGRLRTERRGVPGVEGATGERIAQRNAGGMQALARADADGLARLLPVALAGTTSAGRHHRRVRRAGPRREDPLVGGQQLRRSRSRRGRAHRRQRTDRLRSGAVSSAGAAIEHAVIPACEAKGAAIGVWEPRIGKRLLSARRMVATLEGRDAAPTRGGRRRVDSCRALGRNVASSPAGARTAQSTQCFHNCLLASRAPSTNASSFAHCTWT
jgi:hypothetical protein